MAVQASLKRYWGVAQKLAIVNSRMLPKIGGRPSDVCDIEFLPSTHFYIYIYIYFLRTFNFIKTNYPHALNNNAEIAETGDASSCMFPKIGWRPRSASKRKLLGRIIRYVRARFEAVRPEVMFKGGGALAATVVLLKRGGG